MNSDLPSIEVLVGRDVLRVHDELDHRYPLVNIEALDAIKTHFGWCITGPVPSRMLHPQRQINAILTHCEITNHTPDTLMTQFCTTEGFGVRSS